MELNKQLILPILIPFCPGGSHKAHRIHIIRPLRSFCPRARTVLLRDVGAGKPEDLEPGAELGGRGRLDALRRVKQRQVRGRRFARVMRWVTAFILRAILPTHPVCFPALITRETRRQRILEPTDEVVSRETRVLQNTNRQTAAYVTSCVNGDCHRDSSALVAKRKMTSRLPVFLESSVFQETNKFARGSLRKSRHAGMPIESSSTCTLRSF